ncbi:AMP-binding enzyme [Sinomicrobium oceani]|uniref:AMP-binding enzyme n=1 Tax=Sinomicrobium oceani TaxID=1150368 RepID=A0A1K1NHB0_9FLAO|nr:AMP-binding protein [Sinomicrobium oceani]SFW34653.1 AMP-binding enzyme [Sinomicrobium oceani]
MGLYDIIKANENLTFIDAGSGVSRSFGEIDGSLDIENLRSVVFIYNDNQLPAIETFLNFYRTDHVAALLGAGLHEEFKQHLETEYKPYYIYDPLRSRIPGYIRLDVSDAITLFRRWEKPEEYAIHPKIKVLMSTSGTTGSPKFVRISDDNLVHNASSILEYMPVSSDDVAPLNVPVNFVYGLSIFTTNCIRGGTIVCTDKDAFRKEFWTDFTKYGYTTLGGVPYFYEMLHRIGFFKKDYPSLKYLTHTGGMLNSQLIEVISDYSQKLGKRFFAQYGQTEASGRMAFLPPQDLGRKGSSIGVPIEGGRFEIDEETAELVYYGPNVSGGYASASSDLKFFETREKLYTGDRARKDEEGYYYIIGRIKRIVKLFGIRLNLDETELLLKNTFSGKTFICAGINDRFLAVLFTDQDIKKEDVMGVLKEKLNLHASSLKVLYIDNVPLTPNGKVNYPTITKWLESGDVVV